MSQIVSAGARRALVIAIPVIVILIPLGYSLVSPLFAQDSGAGQVFLEMPDPSHTDCVRETSYMRFHHWELLRQIREDVVRYGIRGEVGLQQCKDCHTSRERFCNQCHNAVSLYPDCFGCHYYP
jgi:hypothetical protein